MVVGPQRLVEKPATKTSTTRVVVLSAAAVEILAAHRLRCAERAAGAGAEHAPDRLIFSTSADGTKPWWPSSATRSVRLLQERAGLPLVALQELRRFHSSLLIVGGVDMATESERLGHGPTVALRSYARSNREAHERAADVVADALTEPRAAQA
jgi:integrase